MNRDEVPDCDGENIFTCKTKFWEISSSTISFIIFWHFSMFYQIFLSPQVKRWAIITYKHGIYQFPHELPNDLRPMILGN